MKIITLCNNKDNIKKLCESETDIVGVGHVKFSDKTQARLTNQEIADALAEARKYNKQLYVYLDAFIYDSMISELEELLVYLDQIK